MPETPSEELLQSQANKLSGILRECKIKDEYRPVYAAAFMLALWQGDVSPSPDTVLTQINANAARALSGADKRPFPLRLEVDVENTALAARAGEIIDLFARLNIRPGFSGYDYLGRLYETFFRYTGGNTIGQYFTPRHIIAFICDLLPIGPEHRVFDPACGTGGFLIGAGNKGVTSENLFGIESEHSTAALCVANMVLRGGSGNGIIRGNCFMKPDFPSQPVDFVLMNPPFPHKNTDTGPAEFIDRGLKSLKTGGILAGVFPYSLLVRTSEWHKTILAGNTVCLVATLPPDLFNPYASYNTAILMIRKGVPHGNKKIFSCRIPNDGFKLKKKSRIPREGTLLPSLLAAFASGSDIPQISKVVEITEASAEWSPEAYLDNALHSPERFTRGFEEHIRKQASFYILHGARLLHDASPLRAAGAPPPSPTSGPSAPPGLTKTPDPAKALGLTPASGLPKTLGLTGDLYASASDVSLTDVPLGPMKLDDYLEVALGGNDEIEDLEEGVYPVVSTSEFFNWVTAWKNPSILYPAPCITVATDGSVASTFVQERPFYAFYKVAMLRPRKPIDTDALYYIAYLISLEKWRYVYARKFGKARIRQTSIVVPVLPDGSPDFDGMGEMTRRTHAFPLIRFFRENLP